MKTFAAFTALACLLSGCADYHLGPIQPGYLKNVHTISIPTFTNRTYLPRLEVLVTNTVIKQFQRDGTFRIVGDDNADAILHAEIAGVSRAPARSVRGNVLATTEFLLNVTISYQMTTRDGKPLGVQGTVAGSTSFFVSSDVTTDERQALPLAAEEAAKSLVTQLSEGW